MVCVDYIIPNVKVIMKMAYQSGPTFISGKGFILSASRKISTEILTEDQTYYSLNESTVSYYQTTKCLTKWQ
jgi:hypothetical protein